MFDISPSFDVYCKKTYRRSTSADSACMQFTHDWDLYSSRCSFNCCRSAVRQPPSKQFLTLILILSIAWHTHTLAHRLTTSTHTYTHVESASSVTNFHFISESWLYFIVRTFLLKSKKVDSVGPKKFSVSVAMYDYFWKVEELTRIDKKHFFTCLHVQQICGFFPPFFFLFFKV